MTRPRRKKQNQFLPLLLIITSIAVVAIGIAGIMKARVNATASASNSIVSADSDSHSSENSGVNTSALPADMLTSVTIPDNLPSLIKNYTGFTLSFNPENRTPNYVAWELLGSETDGPASRKGKKFWQDHDLRKCPDNDDYSRSGYDRGHMCPAADQKWSEQAMTDCFVMANMCPQDHALNAGAWNTLENKERTWARRDSALVIVAGPIYSEQDTAHLPNAPVRIPSAFFKVLLAPGTEHPRAIGFIFPNMSSPGNMQAYAASVDDVEKLTGFDFFSALPDDLEAEVESNFSFREWNAR